MRNSDKFEELFSDYIEGELSPDNQRHVDKHLSECSESREKVNRMRFIRDRMKNLETIKTSSSFEQRLHLRVNGFTGNSIVGKSRSRSINGWKMPALGLLMIVAFVSLFWLVDLQTNEGDLIQPQKSSFKSEITTQENTIYKQSVANSEAKIVNAALDSSHQKTKELEDKIKLANEKVRGK